MRALSIGGITGGVTVELCGGNFREGFEQGAMAAGYVYIFNKGGKKIREWFGILNKPSITPTEERKATTSPARPPRPGHYYEIDKTAFAACMGREAYSLLPALGVLLVPGGWTTVVGGAWLFTDAANNAAECRQEATREYKWSSIEDFR